MPFRHKLIALGWLILFLASSCTSFPGLGYGGDLQHGWQQANLLLLKDPGNQDPEHTIIALYMRWKQSELQFRLDLLDMEQPLSNEVMLALDTQPGGTEQLASGITAGLDWDVLLVFPTDQPPYAMASDGSRIQGLVPRIIRDAQLQTLVMAVNPAFLPGNVNRLQVQAFLADPGSGSILDQTQVAGASSPSPGSAPLLLAFWDALPSATPVQALRRWDGAHTGPMGRRHGLSILISEATSRKIPITLLDLKTPDSLSALDLLGGTKWLKKTEVNGLLSLPQVGLADTAGSTMALALSKNATLAFGFRSSQLGYGTFDPNALPPLKAFFTALPDLPQQSLTRWQDHIFIPLPDRQTQSQPEADENGPTLDFKKRLLQIALSPEPDLMIIGGSMPASILADSAVAPLFFEYLATHPWIEPLPETGLLAFPAKRLDQLPLSGCENLLCQAAPEAVPYTSQQQPAPSGLTAAQVREKIRDQLTLLPETTIKEQAMLAYIRLSSPVQAAGSPAIQANYTGQVGYLLAAARWAQDPRPDTDCGQDIDWDGAPECILASQDIFAVVKLDGGRLVFLGQRSGDDVQQWVGQKSQFQINWDLVDEMKADAGPGSDPSEIPGGFFDGFGYTPLTASVSPGEIRLSAPGENDKKTYDLSNDRLRISVHSSEAVQTKIPIVMNAPGRLHPGWIDTYPHPQLIGNSWSWHAANGAGIRVTADEANLEENSFLDSLPFMLQPEIPDRTYPAGHYLPFPLAVLDLATEGNYTVDFEF
jgi:hypothetical protein